MTGAGVHVRDATAADAPAVTAVYAAGIDARAATFETEHPTVAQTGERIAGTRSPHAFLVAVGPDGIAGWAATSPYSPRPVYAGVAEYSVYVDPARQGRGVGGLLLRALLRRAEEAGLHKVTSRVFPENTGSLALAQRHGFRVVGTHLAHARLDGAWRDVVTVEVLLGEARGRTT